MKKLLAIVAIALACNSVEAAEYYSEQDVIMQNRAYQQRYEILSDSMPVMQDCQAVSVMSKSQFRNFMATMRADRYDNAIDQKDHEIVMDRMVDCFLQVERF